MTMTTKKTKKAATLPATIEPAAPLAPLTEREQLAARLPRFKGASLETTPAQFEAICSLFKTDYQEAALIIIERACQGHVDRHGTEAELRMNTVLQQFAELKPQNYLESMLISQMIQVNGTAGKCMERAFLDGQGFNVRDQFANLAIKFHRTFVAQIEALQKLRGKGGQKVTVEHVHVHEGGQAIVGNVNHAPGGGGKNES